MKLAIFWVGCLALCGCRSPLPLTQQGRSIIVVDKPIEMTSECKRLGVVSGRTEHGWGKRYENNYARNIARNRAAEIPGADTLIITDAQRRDHHWEVTGVVFNCNDTHVGE